MEDLLEEIVGNIYDEFDPRTARRLSPWATAGLRVSGSVDLDVLGKRLGVELGAEEDCDTLGGLVFSRLAEIPSDGERPVVECLGRARKRRADTGSPRGLGRGGKAARGGEFGGNGAHRAGKTDTDKIRRTWIMLKGVPSILTPELLKIMMEMGHGDEIVIGDGNYPGGVHGQAPGAP